MIYRGQHGGVADLVSTSQFQGGSWYWITVCVVSVHHFPMSQWVSSGFSSVLLPPKNMTVGSLAILSCP